MKILATLIIAFLPIISVYSQDINGKWYAVLKVQGMELRIVFDIKKMDNGYVTTMDSPDQKAFGISTDTTTFAENKLHIALTGITYDGVLKDGIVKGIFKQSGYEFPLDLSTEKIEKTTPQVRSQDPVKPYPYSEEEVSFINKKAGGIKLVGTLTLPKNIKSPPVVVLISGSGPQDRNEEVSAFNHRPFLVLSDYLTRNGIAVLRYDDRGVASSEGTQSGATSADFATDVEAAVAFLKTRTDIDKSNIGLIGHSEGGLIAPMVAANDSDIAFIILLAGPGVDGATVLQTQSVRANELAGVSYEVMNFNNNLTIQLHELVKKADSVSEAKRNITSYLEFIRENNPSIYTTSMTDDFIKMQAEGLSLPWIMYFIKTHPNEFLSKVKCPVLALNGEKDVQVLPKLNLEGIKKSLDTAGNKNVTTVELKGLNHLFQTAETGSVAEYGAIEETFSPEVMMLIMKWVLEQVE